MKGNTLAIVLLIVGLVVGGGVGYFMAPSETVDGGEGGTGPAVEKIPLDGQTVQLGYISSTTAGLETAVPLVDEIMEVDYNAFAKKLGYDITFEFLVDDATGQAAVHLEKVQGFKSMDVSIYIGGGWSSQAQASLSYTNDNDMLMWSSSSTSPLLAIPDDNLYRMCPTDLVQAPAIAEMLLSHGIKAIVVLQRGDAWADGIYNYFEPAFTAGGGVVLEKIRYAGESTEFSNYLQTAENILADAVAEYGKEHVAVEVIAFSEIVTMVTQAEDYETLYDLYWFGSDGTALVAQLIDDAPEQAEHLKLYSTLMAPAESDKFTDLYNRYFALVSQPLSYYTACTYDIGWVLANSITQSQSVDAMDNIPLQDAIAYGQFGASGWNRLNADGDRYASNYQIWGYETIDGKVDYVTYGFYDSVKGTVTWDTDALGYTP